MPQDPDGWSAAEYADFRRHGHRCRAGALPDTVPGQGLVSGRRGRHEDAAVRSAVWGQAGALTSLRRSKFCTATAARSPGATIAAPSMVMPFFSAAGEASQLAAM